MWLPNVCSIFLAQTLSSCWKLRKCNVRSRNSSDNGYSFPIKCNNISERRFSWKHFHWARSTVTSWLVVNGNGAEIARMPVTELTTIKHLICMQPFIFFDIKTSPRPKYCDLPHQPASSDLLETFAWWHAESLTISEPRNIERMESYSLPSVSLPPLPLWHFAFFDLRPTAGI